MTNAGNPFLSTSKFCLNGHLISYGNTAITYANPPQSFISAGRLLFAQTCSSCHGNDANGVGPDGQATIGPNLQGVGAATVDFWVSTGRMPAADVKAVEAERKPSRLTPLQALELAAWVNSLDPAVPAVPTPHLVGANQSAGADLFSLNCAACHTIEGPADALAFGTNAPSLQNRSVTAQQVAEAIRTGPANMPRFSGNLTDRQVADIVSYVTGRLQHPTNPGGVVARWRRAGGRGLRRPPHRRRRPRPHLLLDRGAFVSDTDHQPSRTRVPMPIAALSDPHMGDAAKNPDRAEKIIGAILFVSVVCFGVAGAAYWQAWSPWTFGGALGAGLFALGFGLTAWGKYLMPQGPFVEERHTLASTPDERDAMSAALVERSAVVVKRRRMLGGLFALGAGVFGIVAAFPLIRSLGPLPGDSLEVTGWRKGMVLVDSNGRPVRRDTLVVGGIMTVYPQDTVNPQTGFITDQGQAVDQTVLIRVSDQPFTHRAGTRGLDSRRLRRLLQAVHAPRLPRRPLRAGARVAGLPLPPVDVQRAQRRGAPVRAGTPAAAPDAPRLQRRRLPDRHGAL